MTRLTREHLGSGELIEALTDLAVRFWDQALDRPVGDGLRVTLQALRSTTDPLVGVQTPSAYFVFHGVAGTAARNYLLEAVDLHERFLPVATIVRLPLEPGENHRGGLRFTSSTVERELPGRTLERDAGIYLASAPTRSVPDGFVGIRGQLVDGETPAAHARVSIRIGEGASAQTKFGVTDTQGGFLVILPRQGERVGTPASTGTPAPAAGTGVKPKNVHIEARYSGDLPATARDKPPDYFRVLNGQTPRALVDRDGAHHGTLPLTLRDEREVVLRSEEIEGGPHGVLRLAPQT